MERAGQAHISSVLDAVAAILVQGHEIIAVTSISESISTLQGVVEQPRGSAVPIIRDDDDTTYNVDVPGGPLRVATIPNPRGRGGDQDRRGSLKLEQWSNDKSLWSSIRKDVFRRAIQ
jgi:hypothetical protein